MADALEKGGDGEEAINLLVPHLVVLFNIILRSGSYPDQWSITTLTPIYKGKGPRLLEGNYRGVSVSVVVGKL